ncbi:lactose/L-arabinose transport system permease protein [Hydrogenispora ethanolica]|uniref:Lactose/L-arabinose transport system permease protein n=1 Tax=Hydrogenispora ethanolica TaxID=1082276 RepID=A0A4R1QQQ9_HYDET|nr:carbohydrate ABC transporter permease [Hydrogenispora ethanolica]TCL56169.1 lactose/L-arabinose transport system permease protein [Hydrogenispora ethanolica]
MKRRNLLFKICAYAFLSIAFVASVFPFYWMIVGMTNAAIEVIQGKMTFGRHLAQNLTILFGQFDVVRIFFNSSKIAILTVIGQLIVSSMAAYGFEFYVTKSREKVYGLVMLSMMVPLAALMVPLFRMMVKFGLLNTHAGLILISLASVFIIFFFRQSFKTFPKEIIQAARVDGAGEFRIFCSIVAPAMKATYAAAAIYAFMTSWNAYMMPLILLQTNQQKTLPLLVSTMASAYFPEYGAVMAAIVLSTLPMILIFFGLQNYFVQGITGSVKQ